MDDLAPDILLKAYQIGFFPMARSVDSKHYEWVKPYQRGIIFLDDFHIPRRLERLYKRAPYRFSKDEAFEEVIEHCRERTFTRRDSWINDPIKKAFLRLFQIGLAHSYECWEGKTLVGGLYGLNLGRIFCGESMFSRRNNVSKFALIELYKDLKASGFHVIDTQFLTAHLKQFGAIEIEDGEYQSLLKKYAFVG